MYLLCSQVQVEEAQGWSESWDELVIDAVAFAEFVIIFEKCFDADLFFPHLCANTGLDVLNGWHTIDWSDYMMKEVRDWLAACLKTEVLISYIYICYYNTQNTTIIIKYK